MSNNTAPRRLLPVATGHRPLALLAMATLIAIALGIPGGRNQLDSEYYRYLAQGEFSKVIQPFASRGLEPSVVRALDRALSIPADLGFAIVASTSLIVCLVAIISIESRAAGRTHWAIAILFLPAWTTLFHAFLLPDIFHCALLAAFCLFLRNRRYWEASLMFIPLYAAREATALVLAVFLITAIGKVKPRIIATAMASTVAGLGLEKWLVLGSQGNRHQISQIAYLAGKAPYNILKNIVGIPFWSPTFEVPCTPTHIYTLPHWRIFGAISAIGPCQWEPLLQANTLMLWLGTFGILPAALFVTLRGRWREIWDADVFLRFCIVYGIIAFAAGPALGTSVHRLVAYGWPAFAMGLPIAAPGLFENRRILLATHLIVGWLSWLVFWKLNSAIWVMLSIAVSLAGWLFTLASLKRTATAMRPTATPLTEEVA